MTNKIFYPNRFDTNSLVIILFSILIVVGGIIMSVVIFTYLSNLDLIQKNAESIMRNNELNKILVNQTREIPNQNHELLLDIDKSIGVLNETHSILEENQEILKSHVLNDTH